MQIQLKLSKPCKQVDKYEAVDAKGEVIKDNPPVGPVYLRKDISKGRETLTIEVK